jgi:hypothetical protein
MKRLSLFEFEDLDWLPQVWRDQITELLHHQIASRGVYRAIVPRIVETLRQTKSSRIIDLGSGSGGDIVGLHEAIDAACGEEIPVLLTDKFPNLEAFKRIDAATHGRVGHIAKSVDATNVPRDVTGLRTMFTAFHHLPPDLAHKILSDAVEARAPILIAEFTERSLLNIAKAIVIGPFIALIDSAFIRPFGWRRLLWTYLIPITPLLYSWDALASHIRTYALDELQAMTADLSDKGYDWQMGHVPIEEFGDPLIKAGGRLTYLIGTPDQS